jgi:hypothetical protein
MTDYQATIIASALRDIRDCIIDVKTAIEQNTEVLKGIANDSFEKSIASRERNSEG